MQRITGTLVRNRDRFVYDFETFKDAMLSAGFREVHRESYLNGRDPKVLVEHEPRSKESFYAEGIA